MASKKIAIRGAGVTGLWQALTLAHAGHDVTVYERSAAPFTGASSRLAGAMLAPYCEEEDGGPLIRKLGGESIGAWSSIYPGTRHDGTLVVAMPRDLGEIYRFARVTQGHRRIARDELTELEPELAANFSNALFYEDEGQVAPRPALDAAMDAAGASGVQFRFGEAATPQGYDLVVDCRGLAARDALPELRGVRGERIVLRSREIALSRPVRLLHPRNPIYVVPWGDGLFVVGATTIESEEWGPVSVRSALDLLGAAYAMIPAFAEAEIVEMEAGVRPAFPDNLPRIVARGGTLHVNGLYRHGYLLAPAMARLVAEHVATGRAPEEVFA